MSESSYLRCDALANLGIDHGFETRGAGSRGSGSNSPPGVVTAKQVHGTTLLRAPFGENDREADAIWTSNPGTAVAVYTADCVPILIASRDRSFVAAVHAGWRGTVSEILLGVTRQLVEQLRVAAKELVVAVGPHIGPCCYEIDAPVLEHVKRPEALHPAKRKGHAMLDLFDLNREQLVRAGVAEESIHRVPGCTCCEPRFCSYRRDGGGSRMLHYVRMPG